MKINKVETVTSLIFLIPDLHIQPYLVTQMVERVWSKLYFYYYYYSFFFFSWNINGQCIPYSFIKNTASFSPEKDLGFLVEYKSTITLQYVLVAKKPCGILRCIRKRIASRSRQEILPSTQPLWCLIWSAASSSGIPRMFFKKKQWTTGDGPKRCNKDD